MPPKRRASKRRPAVSAEDWGMVFESGHDFFADLADFGLVEPVRVPMGPEREAAQATWMAAIRAAWAEHGAGYLRTREARQHARPVPWAQETFGDSETCQ